MAGPLLIVPAIVQGAAWGWRAIQVARAARAARAAAELARRAAEAARATAASEPTRQAAAQIARTTSQAQQLSQVQSRAEVCDGCADIVPCFNKPDGVTDEEFDRQLKEQEDTINQTSADMLLQRRQAIRDAGGTDGVRDHRAQTRARDRHLSEALESGMSRREARDAMRRLDATHALDIIAGGDPSLITGLADRSVNRSLGGQWQGARSQALEDEAQRMHAEGRGAEKMKVKLVKC